MMTLNGNIEEFSSTNQDRQLMAVGRVTEPNEMRGFHLVKEKDDIERIMMEYSDGLRETVHTARACRLQRR